MAEMPRTGHREGSQSLLKAVLCRVSTQAGTCSDATAQRDHPPRRDRGGKLHPPGMTSGTGFWRRDTNGAGHGCSFRKRMECVSFKGGSVCSYVSNAVHQPSGGSSGRSSWCLSGLLDSSAVSAQL